ncbi:hypothetical protein ACWC24_05035 [Streptomyces sp. NPDC001443]
MSNSGLDSLVAVSADEAWAVDDQGVLWHWDGSRRRRTWLPIRVVDLDAASPDNVWAVGTRMPRRPPNQLAAMRYDGHGWQQTRLPEHRFTRNGMLPGEIGTIDYVRVLAAGDVWARGAHTWQPEEEEATDPPQVEDWTEADVDPVKRQWLSLSEPAVMPGTPPFSGPGASAPTKGARRSSSGTKQAPPEP